MSSGRNACALARLLALALAFAGTAAAERAFRHLGPVEVLDNGVARLEVAPQIGRIVSFRLLEGAEWLAVDDSAPNPQWHWNPWGGDRIWPTAQFLCHQIYGNSGFDPAIDGKPWKIVSRTPTSLEFRSEESPQLGLVVTRRVELPPGRAEAVLSYRLERRNTSAYPVHVWAVTGISPPDYFLMESDPGRAHPEGRPFVWWKEHSSRLPVPEMLDGPRVLKAALGEKMKIGSYGRWVAAVRRNEAFLQTIDYDESALYLEKSNLQAFWDPRVRICELETLSPSWSLAKGGVETWTVRWRLLRFPQEAESPEQKARWLGRAAPEQ